MQTIFISEIDKLKTFDIVRLIDDKTNKFKGYFLNPKYHNVVKGIEIQEDRDKESLIKEFERVSKNISILEDKTIDLCKIDEDMNGDISFYTNNNRSTKINE